ncbi:hypothetical protein HBI55_105370 [Parastagonospora nodorum]|nr:hypothetical protein HBI47_112500 [Parastagonospora nodorum]KAH5773357.1 hypothetical protein HBI16_105460 [Parastagonospora nodorum]KAH6096932.1 hypothetical protein HBI65_095730 [Parastagonospora nodorum]KAH6495183.1 hypothetical protein HBI55_105370 [Parastagonospora nodorum]
MGAEVQPISMYQWGAASKSLKRWCLVCCTYVVRMLHCETATGEKKCNFLNKGYGAMLGGEQGPSLLKSRNAWCRSCGSTATQPLCGVDGGSEGGWRRQSWVRHAPQVKVTR